MTRRLISTVRSGRSGETSTSFNDPGNPHTPVMQQNRCMYESGATNTGFPGIPPLRNFLLGADSGCS
jgi:hypothetical protein